MPASVNACSKARRCESVSTVEPDLEETTTTVRSSRSASASRTWSGLLESSTVSSTPYDAQMTSGARDEPPMPQSTTWSTPASWSSLRSAETSPTRCRDVRGRPTQEEPLRGLLLGLGAPQRRVLGEQLPGEPVLDEPRHVRADRLRRGSGGRHLEGLAHFLRPQLTLDRLDELVHEATNFSTPSRSRVSITSS